MIRHYAGYVSGRTASSTNLKRPSGLHCGKFCNFGIFLSSVMPVCFQNVEFSIQSADALNVLYVLYWTYMRSVTDGVVLGEKRLKVSCMLQCKDAWKLHSEGCRVFLSGL